MNGDADPGLSPAADAILAAALFAVDPSGIGGILVRAGAGPVRDRWLTNLARLMPSGLPLRKLPSHAGDGRILGGLDLAATLRAQKPVVERGILSEADGGAVVVAMAERIAPALAARLAAVLDAGAVVLERDGQSLRLPASIGVVALDEGIAPDEKPRPALCERLGLWLDLTALGIGDMADSPLADAITPARARLATVATDESIIAALCETALALGVFSIRASLLALKVGRASAALHGRTSVSREDAATAARLVLGPRATRMPAEQADQKGSSENTSEPEAEPADQEPPTDTDDSQKDDSEKSLAETVLAAAKSALPPGLLAQLREAKAGRPKSSGQAGALHLSTLRGRPIGVQRGQLRAGARLNVIETLRAAAPWQALRQREPGRVKILREDFRIARFKQHAETTMIFVVDASGSLALNRLSEAKGAVELLLADCYVRRDQVALLAFRGQGADLLLPPTRSLARAKRSLAGLPGGGGTPLAAGIEAAVILAHAVRRKGQTPVMVLMTDGRANVGRDGRPGRAAAEAEALAAARLARAAGFTSLLIDTALRPQAPARKLAEAMAALYIPLPLADAKALSQAVRAVSA